MSNHQIAEAEARIRAELLLPPPSGVDQSAYRRGLYRALDLLRPPTLWRVYASPRQPSKDFAWVVTVAAPSAREAQAKVLRKLRRTLPNRVKRDRIRKQRQSRREEINRGT